MKHTITNRLAALLLLVIGVMGCSKEETLPSGTPDTTRIPITISVTDGGYAANDKSTAQSRAVEEEYVTTFTAGDKIGLYVVKPDGSSYAHENENIELTLTDNGNGTPVWTPPAGTMLYYDAEAKYFAYYPYQSTLTGDLVPSAEDAAGFFTNVVSKWTPATDQSSYDLYTASDLMVGSGTVSKQADGTCPLALTMTHAMALVVIETPTTKYSLSDNDDDDDYTWTAAAPDTKFYGFTPYSPTLGTYRYLVKPDQSGPDLYGSYTGRNGTTKEYIIKQNSTAPANYVRYKVDGGTTATVAEKTHTLKVGDYYLKDGSLLSVSENEILTKQQQDACIGIVYWVGDDAIAKDRTLKKDHPGCTHGLVVSLKEDEDVTWQNPYRSVQDWLNDKKNGEFLPVQSGNEADDPLNNIQGYNNTKAIEAFNADAANSGHLVTAVQKAVEYRAKVLAPSSSSDWYLPSAKELTLLCGKNVGDILNNSSDVTNRDLINGKLKLIDGATELSPSSYWSSSESTNDFAFDVSFFSGRVGFTQKYYSQYDRVRFSLAF